MSDFLPDLNALFGDNEEETPQENKGQDVYFKLPEEARTVIRILPGNSPDAKPMVIWYETWNVADRGPILIATTEEEFENSPVRKLEKRLRAFVKANPQAKEALTGDSSVLRAFRAQKKVGMNVLFRGKEDGGVGILRLPGGFITWVKKEIPTQRALDPTWNFLHPTTGNDLMVSYFPQTYKKSPGQMYSYTFAPKQIPIGLENWASSLHDLKERCIDTMQVISPEAIVTILQAKYGDIMHSYGLPKVADIVR